MLLDVNQNFAILLRLLEMMQFMIIFIPDILYEIYTKQQILDSSKLKEFAYDNFEFDENGRKFSKKGRKHCW